jgi:hypothetical protein
MCSCRNKTKVTTKKSTCRYSDDYVRQIQNQLSNEFNSRQEEGVMVDALKLTDLLYSGDICGNEILITEIVNRHDFLKK